MHLFAWRNIGCAAAVVLAWAALAPQAHAIPVLSFGKSSSTTTNLFDIVQSGTTTDLTSTNAPITVTLIDAATGVPFSAYFNLSATNTDAATDVSGQYLQNFSGTYSITSGTGGTGTDYLSGSFADLLTGKIGGSGLSLSSSTPPASSVTMTSDVISSNDLGLQRAMALALTDLSSPVAIVDGTLGSATAGVAGDFSAGPTTAVPEPGTISMLGAGLLSLSMLTLVRRKAHRGR